MKSLFVVLAFLLSPLSYGKTLSCVTFLSLNNEGNNTATVTERFIFYLSILSAEQFLTRVELEAFIKSLEEKNTFTHPFSGKASTRSGYQIHHENLQNYMDQSQLLDKNEILRWAKDFLIAQEKAHSSREKNKEETKSAYVLMKFIPVDLSKLNKPQGFNCNHTIEVMQTLVTQKMWEEEMGPRPKDLKTGEDYPLNHVTLWSAMEFANKISQKHGLKPFYDLEQIEWFGSSIRGSVRPKGSLMYEEAFKFLQNSNQNVDTKEGYRLPTIEEQQSLYHHFYKDFKSILNENFWIKENSEGSLHEVGVDPNGRRMGKDDFSDMIGNLFVWTTSLSEIADDDGNKFFKAKVVGGNFKTPTSMLNELFNYNAETDAVYDGVGFRLVRTLVKPKDGKL